MSKTVNGVKPMSQNRNVSATKNNVGNRNKITPKPPPKRNILTKDLPQNNASLNETNTLANTNVSKQFTVINITTKNMTLKRINDFANTPMSFIMGDYLKKYKFTEDTKIYSFNSTDNHIKIELQRLGYKQRQLPQGSSNVDDEKMYFNMKYTFQDKELDYQSLHSEQWYNHFRNNKEMTTKSYLNTNLNNFVEFAAEIDNFFPRCYDFASNKEIGYLKNDYYEQMLFQLLRNHIRYFKRKRPEFMKNIKGIVKQKIVNKNQSTRQNLYHNTYPFTPKVYFEFEQDPNFQASFVLVENFMMYMKSLCRQIYSVEDHVTFYGITRYDKGTIEMLMKYSKIKKDYNLISDKQKQEIGYDESMWKTPNKKLMIEMYKLHKVFKLHKVEYLRDGEKNIWIIKPSGNARGMGIHLENELKDIVGSSSQNTDRLVMKYIENP